MVFNDRIVKLERFMVEPNQIQPGKKTYKDIYYILGADLFSI